MNKKYNVGIYIRLSREDGDNLESESIINQRQLLSKYVKENEEFTYVCEYVDDGYSGSNFNRPAWNKLLCDIKNKKINTIITKDLSRMGRDYISMGEYIERIFPENNIRYIALNDDIDTLYESVGLEFLQFKLVFNDYYLKDTSKKIRKVLKSKKENGQFLGWKAIYGYKRDLNDKYKLVVDEEVRKVVERIFDLAILGKSPKQIADILSMDKVLNPRTYAGMNNNSLSNYLWSARTVEEMLTNQTYIGNLTQGRRKKINYKSKKEIRTNKEDWIIVNNTHEAIISREQFNLVQELLKKNRQVVVKNNNYLLRGLLFCKECGHSIGINKSSDKKRRYTYCSYYQTHSKFKVCSVHSNNYDKLESYVIENLREILDHNMDKNKLRSRVDMLIRNSNINIELSKRISILDKNISNNLSYIDKVYEDKIKGIIDFDMFNRLTNKYKNQIATWKKEKVELEKKINRNTCDNEDNFNKIEKYLLLEKIERNLIISLVDKILISEDKGIDIYYKFNNLS